MTEPQRCEYDGDIHDWFYKVDWYGDPDAVNGTADCSHWECRKCGEVDFERDSPDRDEDYLR